MPVDPTSSAPRATNSRSAACASNPSTTNSAAPYALALSGTAPALATSTHLGRAPTSQGADHTRSERANQAWSAASRHVPLSADWVEPLVERKVV